MKLISCYIENFGNLSQKTIDFNENITSFYKENGYGKSTLASFIKAMFFGLEKVTTSTKNFLDRKHYFPFNEQLFGGNITFSYNGKTYKIERYFDSKSETKDEFKLYCNGTISEEFSKEIGKELFGIDKESFERLMFVNNDDIEIKSTSSINFKLNNDLNSIDFDSVLKRIDKTNKPYKDKGVDSLVVKSKEIIKQLNFDKENKINVKDGLNEKYLKLKELENLIKENETKKQKIISLEIYKANKSKYDEDIKTLEEKESNIKKLDIKYPKGMPTKNDITLINKVIEEINKTESDIKNCKLDLNEEYEYIYLEKKFLDKELKEDDFENISKQIEVYNTLTYKISSSNDKNYNAKEKELLDRFANGKPKEEYLKTLDLEIQNYKNMKDVNENTKTNSSNKSIFMILLFVFTLIALVSIPLFFVSVIVGIILAVLGVMGVVVNLILHLNKVKNANNNNYQDNFNKQVGLIKSYFAMYGYNCEYGIDAEYARLLTDLKDYDLLIEQKEKDSKDYSSILKEKEELESKLKNIFNSFDIKDSIFTTALTNLQLEYSKYNTLKTKKKQKELKEKELKVTLDEKTTQLKVFCDKYNFDMNTISSKTNEIYSDIITYDNLKTEVKLLKEKTIKFKLEKKLDEEVENIEESIDEITEILSNQIDEKSTLIKQIDEDESYINDLDDIIQQIDEEQEKINFYKEKNKLYQKTIDALKQAEQNLKDKYIGPIKDKFLEYANLIEKTLGDKLTMDKNYEISFERHGKNRSEKHLSSGIRSICALCFRLALIDNMYKEDKPFIIMDDPFVNLDEKHIVKAKEIINSLSKNMQIVYFTCHNSRDI